jgi:hypothetical protein
MFDAALHAAKIARISVHCADFGQFMRRNEGLASRVRKEGVDGFSPTKMASVRRSRNNGR